MRHLLTLLLSVIVAACGSAAPAAPRAKPAMWKVSDPDTTLYLFGTVHVLPKGTEWRTPRFDQSVAGADELVLEITDQTDPAAVADVYKRLAYSPGQDPILQRVPADKRPALEAMIKKSGFQAEQLDGMETWAVAITLGAAMHKEMGVSVDNGIERQLTESFKGKPVSGLETTEQQLGYFDKLPEAVQRVLLVSILEDADTATIDFQKMVRAWSSGNTGAIARTFDEELKAAPEIAKVLIDERNANWVQWVNARLNKPGTAMVAVGAGHLAGKGSVVDLLKRQGLKIERVQ
jgi:uncharacterized protein